MQYLNRLLTRVRAGLLGLVFRVAVPPGVVFLRIALWARPDAQAADWNRRLILRLRRLK